MLRTGSVVDGKYRILHVIGRGGMSIVYLAMNERANKQWAIKEIQKKHLRRYDLHKKEIEMMKKLRHPSLPGIVDVIELRDSLLIVMDYIEGQTLDEILEDYGPQREETVRNWGLQLCEVLQYLHSREPPIIYRDMKPSNVIVKPDGRVVLIDLGAAREFQSGHLKDTVLLGTQGYAAPEQYLEWDQSDARTDIYCLGMMMFQLLTRECPQRLVPIRSLKPELSPGMEAILQICTQVKKEDRYQSCAELSYALEHYWEYDVQYQKEQKKRLIKFARVAGIALAFGVAACIFAGANIQVQNRHYNAYLLAAQNAVTKEEEMENYRKAIALDPGREDAYLLLLKEGFLDDNMLELQESEELRRILIDFGEKGYTNEARFQKNESGYARFAYEAGIAYFYKFEEKSNKKNAAGYFKIAGEGKGLEEEKKERAKRLYVISQYYSRIGVADEAGDLFLSYAQYWEDLKALSAGNLVELDNARTALVMYEELAGQILSNGAEFQRAGIPRAELEEQLENIQEHLKTDFEEYKRNHAEMFGEEQRKLLSLVDQAEKTVISVYERACKEESLWRN